MKPIRFPLLAITRLFLLGATIAAPLQAEEPVGIDDVTLPRGEAREIDFQTQEGTWMSLHVSSDGKWIAFDLLGQIYRMSIGGGEAVALTQDSGVAVNYHPRFSPDGSRIAFISDRRGQENLWVMNADGSDPRPVALTDDARFAEPAWAPDGQSIVVTKRSRTAAGFYRTADSLWRFPVSGGEGTKLVEFAPGGSGGQARTGTWTGNQRAQWPSFTPDGAYLYFQMSDFSGGGDRRLMRLHLASGQITPVTRDKGPAQQCCGVIAHPTHLLEVSPEVSPDGRYLAFARKLPEGKTSLEGQELNGRTTLWVRDLATGAERMVMDPISNTLAELHAAWQTKTLPGYSWMPDGKSIVLSQGGRFRRLYLEDGHVETIPFIARVHRKISQQARGDVTIRSDFTAKAIRWPATSPDGSKLVFEAVGRLWIRKDSGSAPVPLTANMPEAFQLTPSWSPDGQWIAFATSSDVDGGHVWKVRADGSGLSRLTRAPGRYLYPHWSAEGSRITMSAWPAAIDYDPLDPGYWQFASIPASGGMPRVEGELSIPADISPDGKGGYWLLNAGVISHLAAPSAQPQAVARVPSVSLAGVDSAPKAAVSPDGRKLAIWYLNDVYLLDMPAAAIGAGEPPLLAPFSGKRLTMKGGYYPLWIDNDRLEFSEAGGHAVYTVSTGRTQREPIALVISRHLARGSMAFTNARIIDGLGNPAIIGHVVVRDGRIACVGDCDLSGVTRVVPAEGKTVVPGFVDTHAHHLATEGRDGLVPQHRADSAAYLAYGVTTVFDPSVDTDLHSFSTDEMIEAGRIVGPRSYSTGTALSCGAIAPVREIDSFEEATNQVDRLVDLGVISIKDYKQCTRRQRTWVAEASRRRNVSLTSEGSDYNYILGLTMTGQTGWEHPVLVKPTYSDFARFVGSAGMHYSGQLAIAGDYPDGAPLEYWLARGKYWNDAKAMRWHPWQQMAPRRVATQKPLSDYGFAMESLTAKAINAAGGYVATGGHGEMRGLDTHFEMWALGQSMKPLDVLAAASMGGAHFLGLEKEIGSIENGKLADLVVLNSDPTSDITRSVDISYVMKDGRLYDAETLDEIWPEPHAYGPRAWTNADVQRTDTVPDGKWDR